MHRSALFSTHCTKPESRSLPSVQAASRGMQLYASKCFGARTELSARVDGSLRMCLPQCDSATVDAMHPRGAAGTLSALALNEVAVARTEPATPNEGILANSPVQTNSAGISHLGPYRDRGRGKQPATTAPG